MRAAWFYGVILEIALAIGGATICFLAVWPDMSPAPDNRHVCGLGVLAALICSSTLGMGGFALGLAVGDLIRRIAMGLMERRLNADRSGDDS